MKKFLTILGILYLTNSACAQTDTTHYTIIPLEKSGSLVIFKDSKPTEVFRNCKQSELTAAERAELEALLKRAVKNNSQAEDSLFLAQENEYHQKNPDMPGGIVHYPRKKPDFLYDLSNSKQQYVVALNEKGEKVVFVNCICQDSLNGGNWKTSLIASNANWQCYFNLLINLTTKTYSNLNEICVNCTFQEK